MTKKPKPKLQSNKKAMKLLAKLVHQGLPDANIQARLEQEIGNRWHIDTIRANRQKLGITKQPGSQTIDDSLMDAPLPGLGNREKAEWFRDQFCKSYMFDILQTQFDSEEVQIYLEEYGRVCVQFEDIVSTEHFQIDDFLKHRLLILQELRLKKDLRNEVKKLKKTIASNPLSDEPSKEERQLHMERIRKLNDATQSIGKTSDRYDKLVAERDRIYKNLGASRRDRLDELRGGKESFFEIITKLQHLKEERDRQGKYAELTKLAAEDIENEFRKPQEFPDGSIAPIIVDSKTDFGDDDEF